MSRKTNTLRDRYNWRQTTPHAQLVVLTNSVEGTLDNMLEGCTDIRVGADRVLRHSKELQLLVPYLLAGSWESKELG
jgi:hypothetical protein